MEFQYQVQAPGPVLMRLLARMASDPLPAASSHPLSARLSQWIDWPHAVALSAALAVRTSASMGDALTAEDEPDACGEVRAALTATIERDRAFVVGPAAERMPEAAYYRQRYIALQQAMAAEVGLLRRRLRDRLGRHGGELARLAAVDAALEKALGEREQRLLAMLPDRLAAHFDRLRLAHPPARDPIDLLTSFRQDMKSLLFAELDVRLQPARGLFATLRITSERHAD